MHYPGSSRTVVGLLTMPSARLCSRWAAFISCSTLRPSLTMSCSIFLGAMTSVMASGVEVRIYGVNIYNLQRPICYEIDSELICIILYTECAVKRQRRQGSAMRFVQYTSNIASSDAYDEKANVFMGKFHNITDIVMWRSMIQPDEAAFVELDSRGKEQRTISFKKFNQRVTGYAMYLEKKCALKAGDHVILWFSQDLDYVVTLHACWVLGLIPIPLQLPDQPHTNTHQTAVSLVGLGATINGPAITGTNATANHASAAANRIGEEKKSAILTALFCILDEVKVKAILGNMATDDFLKQKTTGTSLRARRAAFSPIYMQTPEAFSTADIFLPAFHNVTKAPKNKQTLGALSGYAPRKEWFAASYPAVYLIDPEVRVGSVAFRKLLKLNHETLNSLCRNQKLQFKVLSGQANIACMTIFNGLGFIRGCLSGIYNGGPTILLQPADVYANPGVWIEAVARYKGNPRDPSMIANGFHSRRKIRVSTY